MKYFYDRFWEKTKILGDYHYKAAFIKKLVPQEKNLRLLDFGCGNGLITQDFLEINPTLKITGVDVSKVAIAMAKKRMPEQKFYTIAEDKELPFKNNSFDVVSAVDVLLCIYDTEFIFKELSRVLSPSGRLLITLPYYGLLKNLVISLFAFDIVFNPRFSSIRFYTKKTLIHEIRAVGLYPIEFGYFGRFYPFSKVMYCISKK